MEWLVIGGGLHGVHIAARLIAEADVHPDDLRIVDPGRCLLSRWQTCTERTNMTHLRSPSVHHLGLKPWALKDFAGRNKKQSKDYFAPPYERPNLGLFNAHCQQVINAHNLEALHLKDSVINCRIQCDGVHVELASGAQICAQNVLLAIGSGDQVVWPKWAPSGHQRIQHIFDPAFDEWPQTMERILVVGAGISGCQIALRLANEGHQVHLMSQHALKCHQFDSDPGWLGPKRMGRFKRERRLAQRRLMIDTARHNGSVPPDIRRRLKIALKENTIVWHQSNVDKVEVCGDALHVTHKHDENLIVNRIFLATGFKKERPGGAMIDALIESANLPCAQCGYPVTNETLQWHPRLFVSGPLAELELGPTARNISGARRAADRIIDAASKQHGMIGTL